jgi:hypothetical protein
MNALISRLISDATAPVEQMSARLFKKAALLLVAIGCLFVCSVIPYNRSFYFRPTIGWNSDRGARNRQSLPRGGFERSQLLLLPEAIDDYVVADNPVRFIDAFVDGLILRVSCTICGIILCEPGPAQARALPWTLLLRAS